MLFNETSLGSNRSEQPNFVQVGPEPVLQRPANSRLGTKYENASRFLDKLGLRRLSHTADAVRSPKQKAPRGAGPEAASRPAEQV